MVAIPNVSGWRRRLVLAFRTLALLIIFLEAISIPRMWTLHPFGRLMGEEMDFLDAVLFTLVATIASGFFLVLARLLSREWGRAALVWLAVLGVHLIQDAVLAWGAYAG